MVYSTTPNKLKRHDSQRLSWKLNNTPGWAFPTIRLLTPDKHRQTALRPPHNKRRNSWHPGTYATQQGTNIDQIPEGAVTALKRAYPMQLQNLFIASACSNHFLTLWKNSIGVVIPKANKPDYAVSKAYRIITLLPCLWKLYETVVLVWPTPHQVLNSIQYSSRAGRNIEQALAHLLSFITRERWYQWRYSWMWKRPSTMYHTSTYKIPCWWHRYHTR